MKAGVDSGKQLGSKGNLKELKPKKYKEKVICLRLCFLSTVVADNAMKFHSIWICH